MERTEHNRAPRARHGKRFMVVATLVTMFAATLALSTPASAAPVLRCWAESGRPSYSGQGAISGWGRFDCNKSVAWMDITVTMERDGFEVYRGGFHATRRPDNGLVGVAQLFGAVCAQSGSYRILTSGFAAGWPYSGASSPPAFISCAPILPV